ncbi:RICIN domain-containing protein [Streptomyces panaciradicis]|nr:RICIN domain-containing protein [Streptomyces panaciradicis]MCL6671882.1 RICIN domain-containing protein [Streptomyces panaciradicis]
MGAPIGPLVDTKIGKCVDAKDSGTADGTRLQLWACAGTSNQKWHLA